MQEIVLIGVNHTTAPVELRECMAFTPDQTADGLRLLKENIAVDEVLLLSTCNRVEILMTSHQAALAVENAKAFIAETKNILPHRFEDALYTYTGDQAVSHIFRVAGSLDSMVIGEPQILGQMKEAYHLSTSSKTSGVILNRLLHKTFSVAKRIRSETGIGDHAVSISYAAIELGKKIFGSLENKPVMLIGAGEMAELAVEHLIRNKSGAIIVSNRTFSRGVHLAKKFGGKAIRFEEMVDFLQQVDIVISSTGSPDYVFSKNQVKAVMRNRKNRPIFFIDIAVPRDIDPEINRIGNAYVYDIDDLNGVIAENIEDRKREALKAERIIDEAVIQFRQWVDTLTVVPTIVLLRRKIETIAQAELEKTVQSLNHLSSDDCLTLNKMMNSLVNKILHDPTVLLKSTGSHWDTKAYLDLIRKLFKLDSP
jgi:glutamyl-tRNA reductase